MRGRAATLKKAELAALGDADLVILNNRKDLHSCAAKVSRPISGFGVPITSRFWEASEHMTVGGRLVFYGAMRRRENWSAALWFLDEALPHLEGDGYRFTVVGANPPEQLPLVCARA